MDRFYHVDAQAALAKFGRFLGRLAPGAREAVHEVTQTATRSLPSKAKKLKDLKKTHPEVLAKKKFVYGSHFPS